MPVKKNKKLSILFAVSEAVPFAKTGGLADVAGALPKALRELGHDVRIVLPKYRSIDVDAFSIKPAWRSVVIDIASIKHLGEIWECAMPGSGIPVYFVDNAEFFNRPGLYRTEEGEYHDNAERFMFFCRCVVEMLKHLEFRPDILHCNDWHTGLIPVYLKTIYRDDSFYRPIKTLYSIHNIAYQGVFDREKLSHAGLPWNLFDPRWLEFYGSINYMKGGIVFADTINTVSKRYRDEITTPEFGWGLDGVLRSREKDFFGVLNGIDYSVWDPATDPHLYANYSTDDLENKKSVKKQLLSEQGLPYSESVPLIGMVTRLDDQKGLDFIAAIIEHLMEMEIQLIVLGTGESQYHDMLDHFKWRYPEKLARTIGFDDALAHAIYAGSDMFLMPSHFEPCGLGQMIGLKYGAVPIVRETGGLADTVTHFDPRSMVGNGFVFRGWNPMDLLTVINEAVDVFSNTRLWTQLTVNGMGQHFSWDDSAAEYEGLYRAMLSG